MFTHLSTYEIEEKAEIIQRAWRGYRARLLLFAMKQHQKERQKALILHMKDLIEVDSPITSKPINTDLHHDLDQSHPTPSPSPTPSIHPSHSTPSLRPLSPLPTKLKLTQFEVDLFLAAYDNDTYFLKVNHFRLHDGQHLDILNHEGNTLLFNAVECHNIEFAKAVLKLGAQVNQR